MDKLDALSLKVASQFEPEIGLTRRAVKARRFRNKIRGRLLVKIQRAKEIVAGCDKYTDEEFLDCRDELFGFRLFCHRYAWLREFKECLVTVFARFTITRCDGEISELERLLEKRDARRGCWGLAVQDPGSGVARGGNPGPAGDQSPRGDGLEGPQPRGPTGRQVGPEGVAPRRGTAEQQGPSQHRGPSGGQQVRKRRDRIPICWSCGLREGHQKHECPYRQPRSDGV